MKIYKIDLSGGRDRDSDLRDTVTGNVAEVLYADTLVTVGSRGIVAQVTSLEMVTGTNSPLILDASKSIDLDANNIGFLKVAKSRHNLL